MQTIIGVYILVCLSSLSVHIYFCFAVSSTSSSLVLLCDKRYTYRCPEESNRPKFDTTLTKVLIMITMMMIIPIARLHTATLDLLRIFCNNSLCCTEDFHTRLSRRKAMAFEIVEVAAKTLRWISRGIMQVGGSRVVVKRRCQSSYCKWNWTFWILCCAVVALVVPLLHVHHWAAARRKSVRNWGWEWFSSGNRSIGVLCRWRLIATIHLRNYLLREVWIYCKCWWLHARLLAGRRTLQTV